MWCSPAPPGRKKTDAGKISPGKIQPFAAAIAPPEGVTRDGDFYLSLLGRAGLVQCRSHPQEMGEPFASVTLPSEHVAGPGDGIRGVVIRTDVIEMTEPT